MPYAGDWMNEKPAVVTYSLWHIHIDGDGKRTIPFECGQRTIFGGKFDENIDSTCPQPQLDDNDLRNIPLKSIKNFIFFSFPAMRENHRK